MARKAIKCSKLFDSASGTVIRDRVILVDDNKIAGVISAAQAVSLEDREIIDLTGKFVAPGLIDCYVHLSGNGEENLSAIKPYWTIGDVTLRCLKHARLSMMGGFTTVRTAGDMGYSAVAARNYIDKGRLWGPRILSAGSALGTTGGHCDSCYNPYITESISSNALADGPDELQKALRINVKYGANCVDFVSTGAVIGRDNRAGVQEMSFDEMKAVCDLAKMHGLATFTHATGASGIKDAVRAGVDAVEHGTLMDEEAVQLMQEHGTVLIPAILSLERLISEGPGAGIAGWIIEKAGAAFERAQWSFRRCLEAGVPIAFGTDASSPFNFHGKQAREFELMVNWGMTPLQALTAATKTAAELLHKSGYVGSLEKGGFADIAAFEDDPTEDIKAMTKCCFVMKDGVVYKG